MNSANMMGMIRNTIKINMAGNINR